MPRQDRLDLLAHLLRNHPGIRAADLARSLRTSVRSVFRDIERLRERGYPVESSRGRGGGLRLHRRWSLSAVRITPEEGLCALLSLAISDRIGLPMFTAEIARTRRLVAAAFPEDQRKRLAPLRERIFVGQLASAAVRASYVAPDPAAMRRLQVAFVEQRIVAAAYRRQDGEEAIRPIEPHALVINWPAWYLLGFDHDRNAARTFRLDRFGRVDVGTRSFTPRPREVAHDLLAAHDVVLEYV